MRENAFRDSWISLREACNYLSAKRYTIMRRTEQKICLRQKSAERGVPEPPSLMIGSETVMLLMNGGRCNDKIVNR